MANPINKGTKIMAKGKKNTVKKTPAQKAVANKSKPAKISVSNLTELKAVNGNLEEGPKVFEFLRKQDFPYEEKTLAEYEKKLNKMTITDMQNHAVEIARIVPNITEREKLKKRLTDIYLEKMGKYIVKYSKEADRNRVQMDSDKAEKILAILNRGR